jgi:DNA-binding MarR family transcriptional regulator
VRRDGPVEPGGALLVADRLADEHGEAVVRAEGGVLLDDVHRVHPRLRDDLLVLEQGEQPQAGATAGLQRAQHVALARREPLRVGEIAVRMGVAGPHVTRQVHLLERRGLVRKLADEHDRRARRIALTPAGAGAAERYVSAVLGKLDDALRGWSAQDRATFYRLLARFADTWPRTSRPTRTSR